MYLLLDLPIHVRRGDQTQFGSLVGRQDDLLGPAVALCRRLEKCVLHGLRVFPKFVIQEFFRGYTISKIYLNEFDNLPHSARRVLHMSDLLNSLSGHLYVSLLYRRLSEHGRGRNVDKFTA